MHAVMRWVVLRDVYNSSLEQQEHLQGVFYIVWVRQSVLGLGSIYFGKSYSFFRYESHFHKWNYPTLTIASKGTLVVLGKIFKYCGSTGGPRYSPICFSRFWLFVDQKTRETANNEKKKFLPNLDLNWQFRYSRDVHKS